MTLHLGKQPQETYIAFQRVLIIHNTLFTALEGGQPLLTASEENVTMTFLTMCNHKGTTTIYSSDSV